MGVPHLSLIERKPEGTGIEVKNVCDVTTGIMVQLEIVEDADSMRYILLHVAVSLDTATPRATCC
jgi:hypothetical protein